MIITGIVSVLFFATVIFGIIKITKLISGKKI
jgi:hypothetical protein